MKNNLSTSRHDELDEFYSRYIESDTFDDFYFYVRWGRESVGSCGEETGVDAF